MKKFVYKGHTVENSIPFQECCWEDYCDESLNPNYGDKINKWVLILTDWMGVKKIRTLELNYQHLF